MIRPLRFFAGLLLAALLASTLHFGRQTSATAQDLPPPPSTTFADCQTVLDIFNVSYLHYALALSAVADDVRIRILPAASDPDMNQIIDACAKKVRQSLCGHQIAPYAGPFVNSHRPSNPQQQTGRAVGALVGGITGLLLGGDRHTAEQWGRVGSQYGDKRGRQLDDLQAHHRDGECRARVAKLGAISKHLAGRITREDR